MSNPTEITSTWWATALSSRERAAEPARPEWAVLVAEVLAVAPDRGAYREVPADAAPEEHLVAPFEPFLDLVRLRLGAEAAAVWPDVRGWLGRRLARIAARALVTDLHRGAPWPGDGARERFAEFVRHTGGRLSELFDRYPVLARLLGETCVRTAEAVGELLRRFTADREALVAGLFDADPGCLTGLELGAGDLHSGGRSVAVLTFADGTRLVYKPRPLGLQARFGELLGWFATVLPELAPRGVQVMPRDGYGWAEFVEHAPCATTAEVDRFHRRQGALLALLYVLDATDMHYENLVAAGDQPVLVDVETLFHPGWTPLTTAGPDPALAALNASVVRTALLPRLLLGEHGSLDVSGVGGQSEVDYPIDVPVWQEAGTDRMRLAPGRVPVTGARNRPLLRGAAADPLEHREALLAGFRAGYDALAERATELSAEHGPLARFAGEEVRLVVRDTRAYGLLLAESTHPRHLADGAAREAAFAELAVDTGHDHLPQLAAHELAELYTGDIPLFTARVGSREVRTGTGEVLPDLLRRSGLAAVRDKLAQLGAVDQREQEWLVEATLATRERMAGHQPSPAAGSPVAGVVPDQPHLLALARGIGDELVARSRQDGDRANWLGLELVDGKHWSVLPMGAGLAEGYCGTALFLAQLGAVTGVARYAELARKAVHGLPALLAALVRHPELAREVGSGGFFGLGGIAYAVARLSALLDDTALRECLPFAVTATRLADEAGRAGIGDGTDGALLAMHAVHTGTGLPLAAEVAAELTERLASRPEPEGAGFLWGAAGTALTRSATPRAGAAAGIGWCSGAAGVALSRPPGDPAADAFVAAAADRRVSGDHSLCHGELGVLDVLVELAATGHERAAATLTRDSAHVLGAIELYGPRCGTPHAVPSPGLLTGIAGIGYGLLRLGFPAEIPSVLLLR
ncbi:type 2 lanthipeptide synthetase LanM family protein [Amycolatopsis sp. 195334CR]|uniref:type 2 lanthipeptide synthetase LanM family protein n=1 Tax=Amycolatopsis sp. 195334CR TaxID=2814588 RepID=UPI001A8D9269|nr:type 2 lanthipeptide synthetase LanM family protein [Amycolatopsis sp. 195334CR]MBN6037605.1 type 2 lantipeptide synthetase LanM family protein [Amycolatopsis sp. 195334CR]